MFMLCSSAIRWLSQAILGHGAYISQDNRLIFLNNSLILAKGWSARLSRRRRWDFRPARGKPAARARARARLIGGELTSKNGGNAGFLLCYFPFWPGKAALRHQESTDRVSCYSPFRAHSFLDTYGTATRDVIVKFLAAPRRCPSRQPAGAHRENDRRAIRRGRAGRP